MFDMQHMHCAIINGENLNFEANYSGFMGDAVFGGSYLKRNELDLHWNDLNHDKVLAAAHQISDQLKEYTYFPSCDPVKILNRGRRFLNYGNKILNEETIQLFPFMDTELIELIYQLPARERYNNKFYEKFLLKHFKEPCEKFPWSKTNRLISKTRYIDLYDNDLIRMKNFIKKLGFKSNKSFTNYEKWIRTDVFKEYVAELVRGNQNNSVAMCPEITNFLHPLNGNNVDLDAFLRSLTLLIYRNSLEI